MDPIRMVDLRSQYLRLQKELDASIRKVIDSTAFINGPVVEEFAGDLSAFLGVRHVVPCANGTDALQVAMMALGLKPGDEVVTPVFTFAATVEVIALLGMKPVFADVDPHTFNITADSIRAVTGPRTRAVIPVHLFGQCAGMEDILELARERGLFVIEDAAQSLGAEYYFSSGKSKKAGTMGHIGCTSFFPSKNLGAYGDGGALFTDSDELAEILRSIVNHGSRVKYFHERIGVNSRLDSLQAAILKVKLKYLNDFNASRQKAAGIYDRYLSGSEKFSVPVRDPRSSHIFHQYTLKTAGNFRDRLKEHLQHKGIPTMVYYPVPLHLQEAYDSAEYRKGSFPVAERLCKRVISLPMHTELTEEQQEYIVDQLKAFEP